MFSLSAEQIQIDCLSHLVVPQRTRVDAIAAVERWNKKIVIRRIAHDLIEINDRIERFLFGSIR